VVVVVVVVVAAAAEVEAELPKNVQTKVEANNIHS
jgi:hypothetical protein